MRVENMHNSSGLMYINSYKPEGQVRNDVCIMFHGVFGMSSNLVSLAKGISGGISGEISGGIAGDIYPLVLDLPNHGNSPTMSPCNFIEMAKMAKKTIEAQRFSDDTAIHILGHSLGGKLAMVYALLYPEITASIIVMDIAPIAYPLWHKNIIEAFHNIEESKPDDRAAAIDIFIQHEIDKNTASFLAKNCMFDGFKDGLKTEGRYVGSKMRVKEIEKDYAVLCDFPHEALMKKIYNKPALFLRAEVSDYFSDENVYEIDKYFPRWEVESIEKAGHNIHIDNPTDTKALITGFYKEII